MSRDWDIKSLLRLKRVKYFQHRMKYVGHWITALATEYNFWFISVGEFTNISLWKEHFKFTELNGSSSIRKLDSKLSAF